MKGMRIFSLFVALTIAVLLFFQTLTAPHQISVAAEDVAYELPYPGILPDHPLYPIKIVRDRIVEFATRDYMKKAQLYVNYADKRIAMAQALAKKGKTRQAVSTLSKAEKYALKIPPLLETSKKQGVSPESDFVLKIKLSNEKHRQVIEQMIAELPHGELDALMQVADLNEEVKKGLQKF